VAVWRQERGVQLGGGIEEPGQRQRPRGGNVVDAGAAPHDSGDQGRDAVVAVDQLHRGIKTHHSRHHFEIQISCQGLRVVRVQAVGEAEGDHGRGLVSHPEVEGERFHLGHVSDERMP